MGDPHDHADAPGSGASPRSPDTHRRTPRRVDTRDPRRSRERALKILFQADIRGESAADLLASIVDDPRAWAMLDELDPDEAGGEPAAPARADAADADPDPSVSGRGQRRDLQLDGFTRSLVQGVADHQDELDALIQRYARRWAVGRMPAIDRNLLRLGTYELGHEITSPAVVINEVIELAKNLSTEDSGRYVNGVLESVRKHLAAQPPVGSVEDPTSDEPPIEPVVSDAVDPRDRLGDEVPGPAPIDDVADELSDDPDATAARTEPVDAEAEQVAAQPAAADVLPDPTDELAAPDADEARPGDEPPEQPQLF